MPFLKKWFQVYKIIFGLLKGWQGKTYLHKIGLSTYTYYVSRYYIPESAQKDTHTHTQHAHTHTPHLKLIADVISIWFQH